MHIVMISGSRNREGRTAQAIEAISQGAIKAGSTTGMFFLPELKIERCRQCESNGWGICRGEQRCIIEDDFDSLVKKIKSADAVVVANPVYFRDLSESLRSFLERLHRIHFRPSMPPPGSPGAAAAAAGTTPAIGLCLAGGGGGGATESCATLEKLLQGCGFDVIDMIPVRRQNFEMKLPILQLTGEWLATKPSTAQGPPPN